MDERITLARLGIVAPQMGLAWKEALADMDIICIVESDAETGEESDSEIRTFANEKEYES